LLDGPGYSLNMSYARVRHYASLAGHFTELAPGLRRPALVLGSLPSPELCEAGLKYARERDVPFVVDIRDPWPDIFPEYLPKGLRWLTAPFLAHYRRKMRVIARGADAIVAVSEAMLDWGVKYAGRARRVSDRVFHIGFGRQRIERELTVPTQFTAEQPLVCLFATTCGRSYDGGLLVEAAKLLAKSGEKRVRFIVTGDGDMRAKWIAQAGGVENVLFTGWIPDEEMRKHFLAAHIGLVLMTGGITRFWLGNKIFEYLSGSLAVLNDVGGEPATLIRTRDVGVNVTGKDPDRIASELRALVNDSQRVLACMRNAKSVFEAEFDRDIVNEAYMRFLLDMAHHGSLKVAV
jgi:glycosyltransferase involved in cell wall biosynthesis